MSGFCTSALGPPLSSLPYLPKVVIGLLLVSTTSTRNCPRFGKNTRPNGSTSKPEPSHMQWLVTDRVAGLDRHGFLAERRLRGAECPTEKQDRRDGVKGLHHFSVG